MAKIKICKDEIHPKSEVHISLPDADIYIYGSKKERKRLGKLITKVLNDKSD